MNLRKNPKYGSAILPMSFPILVSLEAGTHDIKIYMIKRIEKIFIAY